MSTVGEFYLACRNGDLDAVQDLLPNMSNEQKNRIESNGSTALHAAAYFGHHAIVKLLLKNGCTAWIRNKYGKMQNAVNCSIGLIENKDFNDFASTDDCFTILTRNVDTEDDIHKGWIDGYKHNGTPEEREAIVQQIPHTQMMKYCLTKFQEN